MQRPRSRDINVVAKYLGEVQTEPGKIDQCATFLELNEEVDVATDRRFTPSSRPTREPDPDS